MLRDNNSQIIELMDQTVWNLAEVKNYMRITTDYDDGLIKSLIDTAIIVAENFTKLTIRAKRVKFTCNMQNQRSFPFKYNPLKELVKVSLINEGQEIILQNGQYFVDHEQSTLCLNEELKGKKLVVEYITGFDAKNLPLSIKHGILLHIAEMYDREESNSIALSTEIKNLYLPYRQLRI